MISLKYSELGYIAVIGNSAERAAIEGISGF